MNDRVKDNVALRFETKLAWLDNFILLSWSQEMRNYLAVQINEWNGDYVYFSLKDKVIKIKSNMSWFFWIA